MKGGPTYPMMSGNDWAKAGKSLTPSFGQEGSGKMEAYPFPAPPLAASRRRNKDRGALLEPLLLEGFLVQLKT